MNSDDELETKFKEEKEKKIKEINENIKKVDKTLLKINKEVNQDTDTSGYSKSLYLN